MKTYAVIDTNVLVSALISKNPNSATVQVVRAIFEGIIIPLYHNNIIDEYKEVLSRPKFHLNENRTKKIIKAIKQYGIEVFPKPSGEIFVDMDDLIFYEVVIEKQKDKAYLVTGNLKHYPQKHFIVTPAEMLEIINKTMKN